MPQSKQPIPEGLRTVTPQLVVKDALRLVDFLKAAFRGNRRAGPPR